MPRRDPAGDGGELVDLLVLIGAVCGLSLLALLLIGVGWGLGGVSL